MFFVEGGGGGGSSTMTKVSQGRGGRVEAKSEVDNNLYGEMMMGLGEWSGEI